ncbi:MAG: 50S ribosomal protein L24 [Clostridiales bacterium]|nr:50S ribosomal protein L24 [Clostridiales bacterium]
MNKVHVKTGDEVVVINGKYRGKRGKVMQVSPSEGKVIVEGVNIVKKHVKPRQMGEPGGIIEAESALYADKVQLICPKCSKPTRVGHSVNKDGKKVRTCKKCQAEF